MYGTRHKAQQRASMPLSRYAVARVYGKIAVDGMSGWVATTSHSSRRSFSNSALWLIFSFRLLGARSPHPRNNGGNTISHFHASLHIRNPSQPEKYD